MLLTLFHHQTSDHISFFFHSQHTSTSLEQQTNEKRDSPRFQKINKKYLKYLSMGLNCSLLKRQSLCLKCKRLDSDAKFASDNPELALLSSSSCPPSGMHHSSNTNSCVICHITEHLQSINLF